MFTIPILALWIAWAFATTWQGRLKTFALACAVVAAVLAVNGLLAYLYSSPLVATGSNFAYSVCGLSLGADWSHCSRVYSAQLQALPDERAQATFLFAVSWQNIIDRPTVLLSQLAENVLIYFRKLPEMLLAGYSAAYEVSGAITMLASLAVLTSLVLLYRVRGTLLEGTFWALVFVSSAMSAAIIMADDGWRALHVTNALIACFFSAGFSAPGVQALRSSAPPLSWRSGALAIVVVVMLFVAGPSVSRGLMSGEPAKYAPAGAALADENIIPGERFITGFQVIPDGPTRPLNVPTLFVSEFVHLVRMTNVESDFGPFIDVALRRVPFALIVTGRLDNVDQSNIYLAPVTLLEHQDGIAAWRLQVRRAPPGGKSWNTLQDVVTAEPIPVRDRH